MEIDDKIKEYFKDRGYFFSDLKSYYDVEGNNIKLKYELPRDLNLMKNFENPIIDLDSIESKKTKENISNIFSKLYNCNVDLIQAGNRYLMENSATLPIKLEGTIWKNIKKVCYAKKINLNRLFGIELYNLISGNKPINYVFGDKIFVSEQAQGKLLNDYLKGSSFFKKNWLIDEKKYIHNNIRLEVLCSFLSLNDVVENHLNTFIDKEQNIHIIDFDKCFEPRKYRLNPGFQLDIDKNTYFKVVQDEVNLINKRILGNKDSINKVINLMKDIDFGKKNAKQLGNYSNIGEYIEQKIELFEKTN
ncbi:MAG: hypothetical protein ACOC16_02640 [Nanoarchaeota archaeon]